MSVPKRKNRVQYEAVSKRETRISLQKCEIRVQHVAAPECDLRVSFQKHKTRAQIVGDPNSRESRFSSSPSPIADLRDYLTQKRSVHQITLHYFCEQLISVVLVECHLGPYTSKPSVFNQLSATPASYLAKRCRSRKKKSFSDVEYPEVTSSMVGLSTTPIKLKAKQLALSSGEPGTECSSGLKEKLIEHEGIYQRANTLVDINPWPGELK